jgi:hypothetical protein
MEREKLLENLRKYNLTGFRNPLGLLLWAEYLKLNTKD